MDSVKEYKPGLDITASAYDATNNSNVVTSSEYFEFNEVGIYDTQENRWLDLSEEDLKNPEILNKYSDDSRYAIALGADMNNIDGFMNMDTYLNEKGIKDDGLDVLRKQNQSALERERNSGITNGEAQLNADLNSFWEVKSENNSKEGGYAKLRQDLNNFNNTHETISINNDAVNNINVNDQQAQKVQLNDVLNPVSSFQNENGSNGNIPPELTQKLNNFNGTDISISSSEVKSNSNVDLQPKNYGPSYTGGQPYKR